MNEKELEGKIVIGKFVERRRPTIVENIYAVIREAQMDDRQN